MADNFDELLRVLQEAAEEIENARKTAKKAINKVARQAKKLKASMAKKPVAAKNFIDEKLNSVRRKLVEYAPVAESHIRKGVVNTALIGSMIPAPGNLHAERSPSESSSVDEVTYQPVSNLEETSLSVADIRNEVEKKEEVHEVTKKTYFTFTNRVTDKNNREVKNLEGATAYSVWDVAYMREVKYEANPVGGGTKYLGSFQANLFNAQNILIYAAANPQKYGNIAERFFVKGAKFDKHLKTFQKALRDKGNLAYHMGSSSRAALITDLKPGQRANFAREGLENPEQFLKLQREYGSRVMARFDARGLEKITKTLEQSAVKPQEVSFAVWGMIVAKMVASGNYSGVSGLLEGKTAKQINSIKFIDEISRRFPSIFSQSGVEAVKFAKAHLREGHSITTMGELSAMLDRPEILENYLQQVTQDNKKSLTFAEGEALVAARKKLEASAESRRQAQLDAFIEAHRKPARFTVLDEKLSVQEPKNVEKIMRFKQTINRQRKSR